MEQELIEILKRMESKIDSIENKLERTEAKVDKILL
jgi:hypothetical protein